MSLTNSSDLAAIGAASADMQAEATALAGAAARCDTICLDVGAKLIEAVPILNDLSGRFRLLSETLSGEDMAQACVALSGVAKEVAAIGQQIGHERQSLSALIDINTGLSRLVTSVADDIKFLSAMIPVVKVESVSIDDDTEGLQSFGLILQDLASKARAAIDTYHSTHDKLLRQLDEARKLQTAFELSSRVGLATVTSGIEESLAAVVKRRDGIAVAMNDVAMTTQRIGSQIADVVVALQIGDTIRQRIEHAHDAVLVPAQNGMISANREAPLGLDMSDADVWLAIHRLCALSATQIDDASAEFASGIETARSNLSEVSAATSEIMRTSSILFQSEGGSSLSFLGDLEAKLQTATDLIGDYESSRATIDGVTASVATTFADLETLGSNVASLVTDMTIIGTNAIIKSYRLGVRGAGLSIIAQHLRGHALKVASGIKLLTQSLGEVLSAAKDFTASLEGNGTARMAALNAETARVLETFRANGAVLESAMAELGTETTSVERTVHHALVTLDEIRDIDLCLGAAARQLEATADRAGEYASENREVDAGLDGLLRPRYSMQSERVIHDAIFQRVGT